jgi:PKD repeat protein
VSALAFNGFDPATGLVTGTAEPSTWVHLAAGNAAEEWFETDVKTGSDGAWTVDLTDQLDFEGLGLSAFVTDADRDRTLADRFASSGPAIVSQPETDLVWGGAGAAFSDVTLTVTRGSEELQLDGTTECRSGDAGWFIDPHENPACDWTSPVVFRFDLGAAGWDLQAGDVVMVTNGGASSTDTVRTITIDAISVEDQTITGHANPGQEVWAHGEYSNSGYWGVQAVADGDGLFVLHFIDEYLELNPGSSGQLIAPSDTWATVIYYTVPGGGENTPPEIGPVDLGDPAPTGSMVEASATFIDPDGSQTFTATWDWGDGTTSPATVTDRTVTGSHQYAAIGINTVALTVSDGSAEDTATGTCEVVNAPPAVGAISLGDPAPVGTDVPATAAFSHPDAGQHLTATWDWGDGKKTHGKVIDTTVSGSHKYAVPGPYTVTLTVSDGTAAGTATEDYAVLNTAPEIGAIAPIPAVGIGATVKASATLTHPDAGQAMTATWDWGDGSTPTDGTIKGHKVTGTHVYATAGTYTVGLTVSDGTSTGTTTYESAVVYDPAAATVTGSGSFASPPGAYPATAGATGEATFDLSAKYGRKGALDGKFTFGFPAAKLAFKSGAIDSLAIDGANGWMTGTGKLGRHAGYGFLVAFVDGTGPTVDAVRVRIWKVADGTVVYDSQPGDETTAVAIVPLTGGEIAIVK